MNHSKLAILEQTALPRILVYLNHSSKASRTDLKNNIQASQQAIYNALPLLHEYGLIEELTPKGFPRRKEVVLTTKGKKIAENLEKLESLL